MQSYSCILHMWTYYPSLTLYNSIQQSPQAALYCKVQILQYYRENPKNHILDVQYFYNWF